MTRTLRGGNSPHRVQRQKVHSFSASRDALERATKSELIEVAKDLGVYGEVPRNGSNSTPLVADLRDHLADLAGITLT